MSKTSSTGLGQLRLIGLVAVLTFALTALTAVVGFSTLPAVLFILGYFLVIPLIALLGESFPLVASSPASSDVDSTQDPLETLRDRFARGEIDQEEFERRLESLLETEHVEYSGPTEFDGVRPDASDEKSKELEGR